MKNLIKIILTALIITSCVPDENNIDPATTDIAYDFSLSLWGPYGTGKSPGFLSYIHPKQGHLKLVNKNIKLKLRLEAVLANSAIQEFDFELNDQTDNNGQFKSNFTILSKKENPIRKITKVMLKILSTNEKNIPIEFSYYVEPDFINLAKMEFLSIVSTPDFSVLKGDNVGNRKKYVKSYVFSSNIEMTLK